MTHGVNGLKIKILSLLCIRPAFVVQTVFPFLYVSLYSLLVVINSEWACKYCYRGTTLFNLGYTYPRVYAKTC